MKGKHSIFLLLILMALMSCNDPKPVTDALHRAETLMNEYPDSAWTLLNTISPDEMGQNRNRALYHGNDTAGGGTDVGGDEKRERGVKPLLSLFRNNPLSAIQSLSREKY